MSINYKELENDLLEIVENFAELQLKKGIDISIMVLDPTNQEVSKSIS